MLPYGAVARWVDSGRSVCEQEDGVIRAGVAVDGNRIECPISYAAQEWPEHARLRYRVGRDHAQQGGHVGMDHASAFSVSTDRDSGASLQAYGAVLGSRVGRHDRAGRIDAAA